MTTLDTRNTRGPDVEPPERRRWSRKKIIAVLVAALVGLPALALAATYLFGTITGTAVVSDSTAQITVLDVKGTDSGGGGVVGVTGGPYAGLNCATSLKGGEPAGQQQTINIAAIAYRVNVNGVTPAPGLSLGTCAVVVTVHNGGTAPASVHADVDPLTGWTFTPTSAPPTVAPGTDATITIKIEAMGNAVGTSGGVPIMGKLNVDIPPNGSG